MSRWHPSRAYWTKVRTLHDKLVDRAMPLPQDEDDPIPYDPPSSKHVGGLVEWAVDGRQHSLYVHRIVTLPGYHRVGELVIPVPTLSQATRDKTSITIGYTSTFFKAGITEITVERAATFPTEEMIALVTQGTGMDQLRQMRDSINPHGLLMANMLLAEEMTRPPEAE